MGCSTTRVRDSCLLGPPRAPSIPRSLSSHLGSSHSPFWEGSPLASLVGHLHHCTLSILSLSLVGGSVLCPHLHLWEQWLASRAAVLLYPPQPHTVNPEWSLPPTYKERWSAGGQGNAPSLSFRMAKEGKSSTPESVGWGQVSFRAMIEGGKVRWEGGR